MTLTKSLEYENVQTEAVPLVNNLLNNDLTEFMGDGMNFTQQFKEEFEIVKDYCETNSNYSLNFEEYNLELSCANLTILNDTSSFINSTVEQLVEKAYYEEYDCDFFKCFSEYNVPFFLISQKAHDYWNGKFYFALMVSIILLVLLFFLVENKANFFILTGILVFISAWPIMKIGDILISFYGAIARFINIFFSESGTVFVIFSTISIIFIIIGVVMHSISKGTRFAKWLYEKNILKEKKTVGPEKLKPQETKVIKKVEKK